MQGRGTKPRSVSSPLQHTSSRVEIIAFDDFGNSFHVKLKKKKVKKHTHKKLLSVLLLKPFPTEQHPRQLALRAQEGNALVGAGSLRTCCSRPDGWRLDGRAGQM